MSGFLRLISAALSTAVVLSVPCSVGVSAQAAVVDRIEGDFAVVEYSTAESVKTVDIRVSDINGEVSEGTMIPVACAKGRFYGDGMVSRDLNGNRFVHYRFKSDDGKVSWFLSESDIGFIPRAEDSYLLYYSDNGTTKDTPRFCKCKPEWDCECYLYDDIFFGVECAADLVN